MNRYTYRAEWSAEERGYVAHCLELPYLTRGAMELADAISAVVQAVDDYLAECDETGERPPQPIGERHYSGRFLVRTSPALHARLAVEAADQHVSLNHLVVQKLADRPAAKLFDW